MKKNYIFFLLSLACLTSQAQSACSDAQSDVIYAYSHVKTSFNANNVTHVKQFAKRSIDAINRAKEKLNSCDCEASYNASYDAFQVLTKVAYSNTFEDARFYVKRAKEFIKQTIDELENCTKMSSDDLALVELEHQRLKLKQQQIELQLKEKEIKAQLAEKEEKALMVKKSQLITTNEEAIRDSVDTLNTNLKACGCGSELSYVDTNPETLKSGSLVNIKTYYLTKIKHITTKYLTLLNQCSID